MKWDRRHPSNFPSVDLPLDYLKLVEDTLATATEKGLLELRKKYPDSKFKSYGAIYGDEVLLAITLSHGATNLAATTAYASADYNASLPEPGLEATLAACLDAVGTIFHFYLDPNDSEKIEQLSNHSLSALEEAPFEWTSLEIVENQTVAVWVKIDKSNPELDRLTEEWLSKNDPEYKTRILEPEAEVEKAEEFLEERLEAIKAAKSGGGNQSGPITH